MLLWQIQEATLFVCSTTGASPAPAPPPTAAVLVANSTDAVAPPVKDVKDAGRRDAEDTDDTMRNLRKTFAGIFGDM